MNKEEFLQTLKDSLAEFTEDEKKEILYDYEEHFSTGLENGKTEEELVTELGNPLDIAAQYKTSSPAEEMTALEPASSLQASEEPYVNVSSLTAEQTTSFNTIKENPESKPAIISIIAALALLFFNLVFVLGPYLGLAGTLVGLIAAAFGVTVAGAGVTFGSMFPFIFGGSLGFPGNIPPAAAILFGIGTTALGLLFFIGDFYIAKYFIIGTVKYVKWNMKIIR